MKIRINISGDNERCEMKIDDLLTTLRDYSPFRFTNSQ